VSVVSGGPMPMMKPSLGLRRSATLKPNDCNNQTGQAKANGPRLGSTQWCSPLLLLDGPGLGAVTHFIVGPDAFIVGPGAFVVGPGA
jgi:hypothetical protein